MIRTIAVAGIIAGLLRGPGCGDVDSPQSGTNAPCTRDKDCAPGLFCTEGVCVPPPAPDSGMNDSGTDGGADHDATTSGDA